MFAGTSLTEPKKKVFARHLSKLVGAFSLQRIIAYLQTAN